MKSVSLLSTASLLLLTAATTSAHAASGGAASSSGGVSAGKPQADPSAPVSASLKLSSPVSTAQQLPVLKVVVQRATKKRRTAVKKPYVGGSILVTNATTGQLAIELKAQKIQFSKPTVIQWTPEASQALQPGTYSLALSVVDAKGKQIAVRDQSKTQTQLTVQADQPPPPTNPGCNGDGVFPVAGQHSYGSDSARFNAGRVGHLHQGQDVIAAEGLPIVTPVCGKVFQTAVQSLAGEYVVVNGNDGRAYFFAHCQASSTAVKVGQVVNAGDTLCKLGQTGDASGPHLHFEIWVTSTPADPNGRGAWRVAGSQPIDPLPQLQSWDKQQ